MCFDYRLETLGGWKVGKGGGEGIGSSHGMLGRGKGDTRVVVRKSGIELKKSTFKEKKMVGKWTEQGYL